MTGQSNKNLSYLNSSNDENQEESFEGVHVLLLHNSSNMFGLSDENHFPVDPMENFLNIQSTNLMFD